MSHILLLVRGMFPLVVLDGHQYHAVSHHQHVILKRLPFNGFLLTFSFFPQHVQRQLATRLEETSKASLRRIILFELDVILFFLLLKHVSLFILPLTNLEIIKRKYRHIFYIFILLLTFKFWAAKVRIFLHYYSDKSYLLRDFRVPHFLFESQWDHNTKMGSC